MQIREKTLSHGKYVFLYYEFPVKTKNTNNINKLIEEAVNSAKEHGYIKKGHIVVITGGIMINESGSTNFINVKEIE